MTFSRLDWLYASGAALAAAALGVFLRCLWVRDPEQAERRRRERVNRIGRLAQCEILDIVEPDAAAATAPRSRFARLFRPQEPLGGRSFVVYRYMVSGVSYETSQLMGESSARSLLPRPGQIVSVKYDPAHPSNSILVAQSWSRPSAAAPKAAEPEKGK